MKLGSVESQPEEEWEEMLNVNVKGLLYGMQSVLAQMKMRRTGTIINISSVAGIKTFMDHAVYSGSKFAVHGISESVRWELSPFNVRVITISPGATETELLDHTTSDDIREGYKLWKESVGGVMTADEVASAVVFAYQLPQTVCVRNLVLTPTRQQN